MTEFPKIIHQIYGFWDKKIPKHIQSRIDNWKRLHPDYKYYLWDKKKSREFIKTKYNWFLKLYDSYEYQIQRADAIRYFILYHYGGIYSDIDLEPIKPLDDLLDKYKNKNCILYKSSNSDLLTNDFIISKPKNKFWKKVWHELIINHNFNSFSKHLTVMYTTGPLLIDSSYENFSLRKKYVYVIDSKYINNCDISMTKPCNNKEAYLRRYDGNSWHGFDSTFLNFLYKYKYIIIIILLILLITFIVYKQITSNNEHLNQ
jgi:mannosyltransferase OCH1-like enzyme